MPASCAAAPRPGSNLALAQLVGDALAEAGLPCTAVQLVNTTDRAAVGVLIAMPEFVNVIIPPSALRPPPSAPALWSSPV